MSKKYCIIALILVFSLIIGTVPVFAQNSGVLDTEVYLEAETALFEFGAIDEYTGIVNTNKIKRYEFVRLLVKMYENAGITLNSGVGFKDIAEGSVMAEVLSKAEGIGLVHGDANSNFRGNDYITEAEALTIALNALGYNQIKDEIGSYYEYLSIAYKIDLNENLYASDGLISVSDAHLIIYNMLNTEVLQIESLSMSGGSISEVGYINKSGDTLLESLFGIEYDEGIMVATAAMVLTSDDKLDTDEYELICDDGKKTILICTTGKSYLDCIGMRVRAYWRDSNNIKSVVHIAPVAYDNEYINIEGKNVLEYDYVSRKLAYYEETVVSELESTLKEKYEKIPVDVNVVYNNYYVPDNKLVFDRINEASGFEGKYNIRNIRLLDNDGDGKTDIMFVNMYTNYLVERKTQDGEVMDYYTKDVINLKNTNQLVFIKDKNGEPLDYSSIAVNDVLSIERDIKEENIITVYVVRNYANGFLQSKNDGFGYSFEINDEVIQLANGDYVKKLFDIAQLSGNYVIYFDICDYVAGFNISEDSMSYGYVLDTDEEQGLNGGKLLRLCVPDQSEYGFSLTNYYVKNKVKIDGVTKNAKEYNFEDMEYTLIRFLINSDKEITTIDTPSATRGEGEFSYVNYKEADGSIGTYYRPNWKMFFEESSSIDDKVSANFAVDDNTIMLCVPKGDNIEDAEIRIARIETLSDYFTDWQKYDVHGYVLDENDLTCSVLLTLFSEIDSEAIKTSFSRQRTFVVDRVSTSLNNEGNTAILIKGIEAKKRAAYASSGKQIINYDTGKPITINPGDVLQVMTNAYGDIKAVRRLYNAAKDSYDNTPYSMYVGTTPRVTVGSVFSTNDRFFTMVEKNKPRTWEYAEVFCCNGEYNVYVYDADKEEVKLGSYNDIVAGEDTRIVTWASTGTYLDIIVYKNMNTIN